MIRTKTYDVMGVLAGAVTLLFASGFVLVMLVLGPLICAVTIPFVINSWLHYAGRPEVVVWWMGLLVGFVPGMAYLSVMATIVTWILMLFIG